MSLPPCLTKKHITFGSFNNFAKITPAVIHYWSEILNSVPGSRIVLKNNYNFDQKSEYYWYELLKKGGIDKANVELVSRLPDSKQHLAFYQNIDIALDIFPYNGTTTTCEALWMGVPVITLAGKTHVSRVGVSLLSVIGLEELIDHSPEEYVQKAVALANHQQRLEELRSTLRRRMQSAPLTNASLIAQSLEDAYRQMWRNWCDTQDSVKVSSQELRSLQITGEKDIATAKAVRTQGVEHHRP
ncbi:O-linked N-acetylglucosamine transferase family protein, partial [Limnofasciculus baicalensis]